MVKPIVACALAVMPALLRCCQVPPSDTLSPDDNKAFQAEVARIEALLKTAGDPCTVRYALARTYAAGGQWRDALNTLERTVALKVGLDPGEDEIFTKLRGSREFERLRGQVLADTPPILNARAAFAIDEPTLFPEGIAYSARLNRFLLGSVFRHRIVSCTPDGACQPLVRDGQDGLGEVLGLRISPLDETLWAVSNGDETSGLFRYTLPAGQLLGKFTISRKPHPHTFNDLVVSPAGDVFVTDTAAGTVFRLSHATQRLEVFNPALHVEAANGIAFGDQPRPKLYVAGFPDGIVVVDLASQSFRPISHPSDLCLATIDGLYYYRGDLLAIQNGVMVPRVVRYRLSADRGAIESYQILERRNALFDVPTTGAIAHGAFYFMANTQLESLAGGKIKTGVQLKPIQILRIDLRR